MKMEGVTIGLRTSPGLQTHQFFELRPAVATRRTPEGQEASKLDSRGSNFEIRSEGRPAAVHARARARARAVLWEGHFHGKAAPRGGRRIPVGLNYFKGHRFGGRAIVEFGAPIPGPESPQRRAV